MIDGLFRPLDLEAVSGILPRGGTILRTSRTNPFSEEGGVEAVRKSFEQLDGLIAIGGEDTLGVAARLHGEHGLPVIGVPKTIDNDLAATDQTFGFDTAVSIATRGDRPAAHDRRVARPRDGRRGHGAPRRLAGGRERHRGRRRRRADPRVPAHGRALRRADPAAPRARQGLLDRRRQRGLAADARGGRRRALDDARPSVDAFGHVRLGGVGQQLADALEEHHRASRRA